MKGQHTLPLSLRMRDNLRFSLIAGALRAADPDRNSAVFEGTTSYGPALFFPDFLNVYPGHVWETVNTKSRPGKPRPPLPR
jgi:hypothetical protein